MIRGTRISFFHDMGQVVILTPLLLLEKLKRDGTHKFQILILGGGTAGIITAAQLKKKEPKLDIGIIEPSEKHYYQAAWTLVGAGTYDLEKRFGMKRR